VKDGLKDGVKDGVKDAFGESSGEGGSGIGTGVGDAFGSVDGTATSKFNEMMNPLGVYDLESISQVEFENPVWNFDLLDTSYSFEVPIVPNGGGEFDNAVNMIRLLFRGVMLVMLTWATTAKMLSQLKWST
jgi:hypothetical protein